VLTIPAGRRLWRGGRDQASLGRELEDHLSPNPSINLGHRPRLRPHYAAVATTKAAGWPRSPALAEPYSPSRTNLDHSGVGRAWLLIVPVSAFAHHVRLGPVRWQGVLPRCARAGAGSDRAGVASFRVPGMVRAGQAGAGRADTRCQQVRNASFHGQSGLIFRVRWRACRTRRAGMCHSRWRSVPGSASFSPSQS
jgi:hypothetical protein